MRRRHVRSKIWPGLKAPSCVAFVAAIGLVLSAIAQAALPQPIYFFTDTAQPINKQNPLVIRPRGFLLFQDGQWVLERLRWTGWGSSVARATGVSSSSNDIPNAAQGKRIKTWAHVTLSDPERFQGHEVYRCFTMTVPPPASDMNLCLGHAHGIYILEPMKQRAPTPAATRSDFFTEHGVSCGMSDEPGPVAGRPSELPKSSRPPVREAWGSVCAGGHAATQRKGKKGLLGHETECDPGNPGIAPTFATGKVVAVGAFTCKVLETGVECTVTASGKGFLITPESVTEVGG
jgi:hypothetical protein